MLLLLWFVYILAEAIVQGYFFESDEKFKPDYRILWLFRGAASILHGILLQTENPEHYYNFKDYGVAVVFQMCTFWILFDLILNKLRGKKWNYIGGSDSSQFDKLKPVLYWFLKGLALICAIVSFFLYLKIT
jgi:hypothetical protein